MTTNFSDKSFSSKEKEDFFKEVVMVPLKEFMGENPYFTLPSNEYGIFVKIQEDDNNCPLLVNTVSAGYQLVDNTILFSLIHEKLEEMNLTFEVEYNTFNYCRFFATYKILTINGNSLELKIGEENSFYPVMNFQNCYNSSILLGQNFGFWSTINENQILGFDCDYNSSFSHCKGEYEKILKTTNKNLLGFLESLEEEAIKLQTLQDTVVSENIEVFIDNLISSVNYFSSVKEDILMELSNYTHIAKDITKLDIYLLLTRELYNNPKITCSQSEKITKDKNLCNYLFNKEEDEN